MSPEQNKAKNQAKHKEEAGLKLQTRRLDPDTAKNELLLRASDVETRIQNIEEARFVSQELLSKVVSL